MIVLPAAKGATKSITLTTTDDYQWVAISSSSPMLILSYLLKNLGEESAEYKILLSRQDIDVPEDFDDEDFRLAELVGETALAADASAASAQDGVDIHHGLVVVGVKSAAAGTPTSVYVHLGVSV